MEKIINKTGYIYFLKEGDKQVQCEINHKQYFALSRYYNVDDYMKDLLEKTMSKLKKTIMPYDI